MSIFGSFFGGSKPKKSKYGLGDLVKEQWALTPNTMTDYGNITYTKDPKTGKMVENVNLSPQQLQLLRGSEGVSGSANTLAQQLLAGMPQGAQSVEDAIYKQNASRLDPQWADDLKMLQNRLYGQGIPENSEAWNQAMDQFTRGRTDAYQTARNNSIMGRDQSLATQSNVATQLGQLGRPADLQPQAINPTPAGGQLAQVAQNNTNASNAGKSGGIMGPLLKLGGSALGGWAYGGFQ
jgi:hypothetical protein